MSRVAVIGAGYVGLTTAVHLAHLGHAVVCADADAEKVERLRRGEVPIFEPGLDDLVSDAVAARRLSFVLGAAPAVAGAEFVFLCVPTPQREDGSADLSYVRGACEEIAPVLAPEAVVVNKSTVPVGSTHVVAQALGRDDVSVVSNPEFLREGTAVHDTQHPDRIVIGSDDPAAAIRVAKLYEGIDAPLIVTDPASAETIKYASNAFLATKISFANAVANLCEAVGADVREVMLGMGYDRRIGFEFLRPGPGWGGSCLGKDTAALLHLAEAGGYDFGLLRGVIGVNEEQHDRVVAKVVRAAGGSLDGVAVAAWGVSFKARTDDVRDSPAVAVIRRLQAQGAVVRAYDPAARSVSGVDRADDPYAACEGAAVLVVLTEWDEFRWLDFDKVGGLMSERAVVDARNLLDPAALRRKGFAYEGMGRP